MKTLAKFISKVYGKPIWECLECRYSSEFSTVALFHQHNAHNIPMNKITFTEDMSALVLEDE